MFSSLASYARQMFGRTSVSTGVRPAGMSREDALALGFITASDEADTLSAVNRCITLIANILSAVPIYVKKFSDSKGWEAVPDHPVQYLLSETSDVNDPYHDTTVFAHHWRFSSVLQMLLTGNSCLNIYRNERFQPIKLEFNISPRKLVPHIEPRTLAQRYEFFNGYRLSYLDKSQVLHFAYMPLDGFVGRSPIQIGLDSFRTTSLAEKRSAENMRKGRPEGFITSKGVLDEPKRKEIRDEFEKIHTEERKRVGVLYGDMNWIPYGFSPADMELLSTRKFQLEETCRWFGVPPHMLYTGDKNSYNLAAQLLIEFMQSTIYPMAKQLANSMLMRLFTVSERRRAGYALYFDFDELFRYDSSTYLPAMVQRLQNGIITPNDWRDSECRVRVPDGEKPIIMASQFAPMSQMFATTDVNKVANPTDPTSPNPDKGAANGGT